MPVRKPLPFALAFAFLFLCAHAAFAQAAAPSPSSFNISWSALDPGDDWTWQMLQSVFPVNGAPPTATGNAATVIGTLLGQITGLVMAVAMFFLCYLTIINIHRVAESAQIMTSAMTSMAAVRIGFAAIMMFPLTSGFSVGQAGVMQVAGWGIGMARSLYANAVKAIGPDAMVVADPVIPGTRTIVLALLEDELCRSLVNQATGSTLVPTPTATTVNSGAGAVVTYPYSLAAGNGTGSATCGSVSVADSTAGAATLGGVSIDMANQQLSILNGILNTIRPQVDSIAQSYWQNKTQASLQPLLGVYQSATQSYTQQLTSAAQAITAQLRANLSATDARDGNLGLSKNEVQLSTLGWSSAAAYYLGFARLNGLTLSLASGIPTVNMPTFEGLSPSLQADIAPLFTSSSSFLDKLKTYVSTADGMTSPGGNADTLTGTAGTSAGTDGGGMMERLFRALNFTPTLLQSFVDNLSPTAQNWADPFGGLIALGNQMVMVAMTALGLAGIASTTTGTTATTLFNALTMNWAGVVGTLTLSVLMQFFATPIFMGCMALLIPGLTIAFVLPMIPWVMWIAGIIGYLILVCEAMVAVPLWMMAHLTYEGDGLHGRGFAGYELLFNILFRPVLMIIGLFLGYFIFTCASWLIRMSFGIAAAFVLGDGWIVTNWLGMFVLLSIFVLAHIVAAIASFRMISLIPHHVPRMIGFSSAESGRYGRVCPGRGAHRHAKSAHDDRQKSQPATTDFRNKKVGGTRRSESDRIQMAIKTLVKRIVLRH